jgi:hypothetical protein
MSKRLIVLFGFALFFAFSGFLPAQDKAKTDELPAFKVFIQEHPRALDELKKDPSLIASQDFAKQHKVVGEYLEKHPRVIQQVQAVPHFFDNLTATTRGGEHRPHPDGKGPDKK